MNQSPQAIVSKALQKGWISLPAPARTSNYQKYDKPYRERLYAQGLTARGSERKRRAGISAAIIAAAARDGVGVTAIYNRLRRTGKMTLE